MRSKLLFIAFAVAVVTFSADLRGQGLINGIEVTLPDPVTVGDKVLPPGDYEIRRPSSANRDVLQIFNKDELVYETNVITIPTGPDDTNPQETKVLLHHIGNAYYFDKIWMEDKDYGYEFPLPERVRALQRELAVNVPARYKSTESAPTPQVSPQTGPGLAAELDAVAARQAHDSAQAEADRQRAAAERAADEKERQAQVERDRQAQLDRQQANRDQVAALQNEPAPVTPNQSDAQATAPRQSTVQTSSQPPEQLPETAGNWLALVVAAVLLFAVSFAVRPSRADG